MGEHCRYREARWLDWTLRVDDPIPNTDAMHEGNWEQLPEDDSVHALQRAGIDEGTPCDTMMHMQGRNTFVTGDDL